jgi:hypothetical protein
MQGLALHQTVNWRVADCSCPAVGKSTGNAIVRRRAPSIGARDLTLDRVGLKERLAEGSVAKHRARDHGLASHLQKASHNSDVEADEALGRCAPSGLRSLTPVVMQTPLDALRIALLPLTGDGPIVQRWRADTLKEPDHCISDLCNLWRSGVASKRERLKHAWPASRKTVAMWVVVLLNSLS